MALSAIRQEVAKVLSKNGHGLVLPKFFINGDVGKRSIYSKTTKEINGYTRLQPFTYKERPNFLKAFYMDHIMNRMDENSKLLVVEGNIGAGKSTFAKKLADELDMKHFPEVNLDPEYVNSYGYDFRDYKHLVPESVRPFDVSDFYEKPYHENSAVFQHLMYRYRYLQYIDALGHIMNTGQGVVLERSVYSDYIFLEAMTKFGYLSRKFRKYYFDIRKATVCELMRPHLIIYLDIPVDVALERIKKRGVDYEVKSKVLTPEYLKTMEEIYKYNFLKEMNKHSELLIYDWSNFGDMEVVIEDVERIDFNHYEQDSGKMEDWDIVKEAHWKDKRWQYTYRRIWLLNYIRGISFLDIPEMVAADEDLVAKQEIWNMVPGNQYAPGFNKDMGDKNIWLKH